ncbi:MAG TPA: hypothetical protein VF388_10890 [Lacunisphaera sp.]
MKTITRLFAVLTAVTGSALLAQDSTPAPTVTSTPPPAAAAPQPIRVDGLIQVQKLPTPAQITADAEAEHMSVTRIEQQSDRIIVTYRYASGNTRTFAYTTVLPTNPETEIPATTVVTASPPASPSYTVVYAEPAPYYYYPRYYYDPYWPSTSLSIGLDFGFGRYGHGGYGRYGHWHH